MLDALRRARGERLSLVTPKFSLFAFAEIRELLHSYKNCRLVLPALPENSGDWLGGEHDRHYRNRLQTHWLARQCAAWLQTVEARGTREALPSAMILSDGSSVDSAMDSRGCALTGSCSLTTDGLGLTPGNPYGLVHCAETAAEAASLVNWFENLWRSLRGCDAGPMLAAGLARFTAAHSPSLCRPANTSVFCTCIPGKSPLLMLRCAMCSMRGSMPFWKGRSPELGMTSHASFSRTAILKLRRALQCTRACTTSLVLHREPRSPLKFKSVR